MLREKFSSQNIFFIKQASVRSLIDILKLALLAKPNFRFGAIGINDGVTISFAKVL